MTVLELDQLERRIFEINDIFSSDCYIDEIALQKFDSELNEIINKIENYRESQEKHRNVYNLTYRTGIIH